MDEMAETRRLRQYLLGTLGDESVQTEIEEWLMVDEEFAARVSVVEEELIEEFLDGELSAEDSRHFTRFFLAPPERKRQLRLTRDLRRLSASQLNAVPHQLGNQADRGYSFAWFRYAVVAAIVIVAGVGVWRLGIYKSDTDRGINELQAAYRNRRPVESRITSLSTYAPFSETRGGDLGVPDPAALDRANRYLVDATTGSADAGAHQAYANFYLAAKNYARAESEIKLALQADPKNANILNDAGAIYLEIGKARADSDPAGRLTALNDSVRNLDAALAANPNLLETRFNRALCLQALGNVEEAKIAWRDYIQRDPGSKWTGEAEQKLKELERETPRDLSADQLESAFLDAFRARDEKAAAGLIRANRELIGDKYLPSRLAMSFLAATDDRRDELLQAIDYVAEIETKFTGDPFAKEIALFYRRLPQSQQANLLEAHSQLRAAMAMCRAEDYENCHPDAVKAQSSFESLGDYQHAGIARYLAGYSLKNLRRSADALAEFEAVEAWANDHGYVWLRMTAMHWVATCLQDQKRISDSRRRFEEALSIAKKISDSYAAQRNMLSLALLHSTCGQERLALGYLADVLEESNRRETVLRQRLRNLFVAFPIMFDAGLTGAGKYAAMEATHVADQADNRFWMAQSRAFAAMGAFRTGESQRARELIKESQIKSDTITTESSRNQAKAFSTLQLADLEFAETNFGAAAELYQTASTFYDGDTKAPMLREQAHRGLLLSFLAQGKRNDLQERIALNIAMTDEYRSKIRDEDMSLGFFDLRGNVYEVVAEFEFDRGNPEQAYNYIERVNSRSLFDQIKRRQANRGSDESVFSSEPLGIAAIRSQLPADVQILQYSVFHEKTIAWIISKERFDAVSISIDRETLQDRVTDFANAVSRVPSNDDARLAAISSELFRILVGPVIAKLDPLSELCIIPSSVLFDVPFAALRTGDGTPLISTFRMLYAPSANVFLLSTNQASARGGVKQESLVAAGNPSYSLDKFDGLAPLPNAEDEVRRVSSFYPDAKSFVRAEATKRVFLDALSETDVVHFAGHYVVMPGSPMSSYLLLAADGEDPKKSELSNLELLGVDLPRTRLMIFAACDSGIESYYRSQGMAGMSRTMLAANVPLVVASQWKVDSAATSELMARFHELRRRQAMLTTAALRQAQLELLNDPTGRFSSPYYWAAFAVYGGHADF